MTKRGVGLTARDDAPPPHELLDDGGAVREVEPVDEARQSFPSDEPVELLVGLGEHIRISRQCEQKRLDGV